MLCLSISGGDNLIIVIFGLAASGKTYVGKILSENFNFHYEDADQWLSEEMRAFIQKQEIFSLSMLDDFTKIIIANIEKLSKIYPNLIISQALYRQKNREQIQQHYSFELPKFIEITANDEIIHQRLLDRGDWVNSDYANDIHKFFESMPNVQVIENNSYGEQSIIKQFKNILENISE